jgi:hypothetical protein
LLYIAESTLLISLTLTLIFLLLLPLGFLLVPLLDFIAVSLLVTVHNFEDEVRELNKIRQILARELALLPAQEQLRSPASRLPVPLITNVEQDALRSQRYLNVLVVVVVLHDQEVVHHLLVKRYRLSRGYRLLLGDVLIDGFEDHLVERELVHRLDNVSK